MIYQRAILILAAVVIVMYGTLFLFLRHIEAKSLICEPTNVEAFVIWRASGEGVALERNDKLYSALKRLSGPSFWVKSGDYGYFDLPPQSAKFKDLIEARIWLLPSRNEIWFMATPERPGKIYLLWFWDNPYFADKNGRHYGQHPCKNMVITRAEAEAIYALAKESAHDA